MILKIALGLCLNFTGYISQLQQKQQNAANQSPYTHTVDSLLTHLNKSLVTTGILYDRVFPFARLDEFKNDTTNFEHYKQAYHELYSAHYQPLGNLLAPTDFDDMLDWQTYKKVVPIGIMDMKYNQLKENAVTSKLLIDKNSILYHNKAKAETPFAEKKLQITTLLTDVAQTGITTVKLLPELLLSNTGRQVAYVQIQLSDRNEMLTLKAGDSLNIHFEKEAQIFVTTKTYFTNGEYFSSSSSIDVKKPVITSEINADYSNVKLAHQPCQKQTVVADIPFKGYDEKEERFGQVEVNYFYHYEPTDTLGCQVKKLKKPIIVLDGFDPTDKRDATWIYENNFKYYNEKNMASNFADEQRRQGFDIIIINMPSYHDGVKKIILPNDKQVEIGTLRRAGGDYIELNAMALIKVIQNFNNELKANNSNEKLIVVGPSMGGVISRYGLSYMEKNKLPHNTRLWFSWDATHLGSVLPIGNQYFIEAMGKLGLKNVKDIINRQINSVASKQELNHHMLANSYEPEGAPNFKDRFYQGMDSMGWPQQTRKIAMISGAIKGLNQPKGEAGGTAFDFKLKMNKTPRLLLFNLPGLFVDPNFIRATISFSPSATMKEAEVLNMNVLGFKSQKKSAQHFENSNNSMDLIQGGWYPGFQEIRDSTKDKLKGVFKWLANPQFLNVVNNHCHQPSANTLAFGQGPYPNPNRKWDDNLSLTNFNCGTEKETPWDAWYAPEENLRHDSLTNEYAWRMRDEMNGKNIPQPKVKREVTIEGNTTNICINETRTYKVPNACADAYYNWDTSNPQLQIISGQGTSQITVYYKGGITQNAHITCAAISNCYEYQIHPATLTSFTNTSSQDLLTILKK
jgi:hypothetical protein